MELSVGKILLILLVLILVFGTAKLPKVGEDLGKAIRNFKKASQEAEDDASRPDEHHR
ncbi:MAG: twin-arginine translocase TatA/TatE family subunit [Gammaproteobacteria bacterium]|nr:twin-arginine translocase TatA/TatE family subunit [Gammaproteobacteria bacterium]MDE2346055.1 twin-arginine translocase TatA/TatE family subunit [Gammaproteobacteria bacterium]